jgi:hypothetical protein
MGRTYTNKRDFDDYEKSPKLKGKPSKHSRNISGKGMRVINRLSDDDYEDDEIDLQAYDDEQDENTSIIQRK